MSLENNAAGSSAAHKRSLYPKLAEVVGYVGRPVAFYPSLVPLLGSVNAVLLFCQLFYWKVRAKHDYIYKTSEAIQKETGLTYAQQRTARRELVGKGVLRERYARLQHELHFYLDHSPLSQLKLEYEAKRLKEAA